MRMAVIHMLKYSVHRVADPKVGPKVGPKPGFKFKLKPPSRFEGQLRCQCVVTGARYG
jgi:hypothetical protein